MTDRLVSGGVKMARKGGRPPSFDEDKTVKTSITSLQGPYG